MKLKHLLKSAAFAVALCFGAGGAQAASVTIDFDGLSNGTLVTNQFTGVTFSTAGADGAYAIAGGAGSAPNGLLNGFGAPGRQSDLMMAFDSAVDMVSFSVNGENGDFSVIVEQGAIFTTLDFLYDGNPADLELVDLASFAGVTKLTTDVNEIGGGGIDAVIIDDISFNTTVVPLPAGLPLLFAGLGGLAMLRRARRRAQPGPQCNH